MLQQVGSTRRGFVAGAAAGAAAQILAPWGADAALAAGPPKRCAGRAPGVRRSAIAVSHDGRTLWTADTGADTISSYGTHGLARHRTIEVGDAPVGIALTRDGRQALVTTGFYEQPGLALVDLRARKVTRRVDVGATPETVAIAPGGRFAYVVAGDAHGRLTRVDLRAGAAAGAIDLGQHPRGLAFTADGRHALVALNGEAHVAVVSLRTFAVVRRIATQPFPFLVAAAPRGDHAFVSHNGFGADRLSHLDVGAGTAHTAMRTGADPAGVAFARSGALLVASRGAGTITSFDPGSGRRRRRVRTGGRPRALAAHGRRVFAADEETGQLWAVRI
jgi:DNA-binding beta-propeller fold protein YncE